MSKRLPVVTLACGLICYLLLIGPFTGYMINKPVEEKLGYVPSIRLLKPLSADQKELAAASLVFKVLAYYGGVMGSAPEGVITAPPDLQGMSRLLHGAVQLDPYNMDAYYFAQGILTWDAGQYQVANELLLYGMKHRTWDWYLPFFLAFNYAYFLKDYEKAAQYYQVTAQLSGEPLYGSLASRYLQQSGQTDLALRYLTAMLRSAKNDTVKRMYQLRLKAFEEVKRIEVARDRFRAQTGAPPDSLDQLVKSGYLKPAPVDPYGGSFYLGADGKVATTSKFAFAPKQKR